MLTDVILEEDFEKNSESWYGTHELEHDLHLAAELGKTLLDRNRELEQALQQMYSNNHDQLQEIEYLTKQVELLRHTNDQHARVYEQLDASARDLERTNRKLLQDNRLNQQRIDSLTETIDGLQAHIEDLQSQVEELKTIQAARKKREQAEQRRSLGAQSVSCLKELYDLHHDGWRADDLWSPSRSVSDRDRRHDPEEEHARLQRTVHGLQKQIDAERRRREAAEHELDFTAGENRGLEQRLAVLAGCQVRQKELEEEVEQLRLLWRADSAKGTRGLHQLLLPDTMFFGPEEKPSKSEEEEKEEDEEAEEEQRRRRLRQRCLSDGFLRESNAEEIRRSHERMCVRRAEAVKQRGVSLLNEVDAQYSALQVKYEALLRRCQQSDGLSHKGVQTSGGLSATSRIRRRLSNSAALPDPGLDENQQPEYKTLFKEIFTCIQKSREDLSENRTARSDISPSD